MLNNFARPECDLSCGNYGENDTFENLLKKYDDIDALVSADYISQRFITDRKPLSSVSRMHNRYQVLNNKEELVALCRTLAQAQSHL